MSCGSRVSNARTAKGDATYKGREEERPGRVGYGGRGTTEYDGGYEGTYEHGAGVGV